MHKTPSKLTTSIVAVAGTTSMLRDALCNCCRTVNAPYSCGTAAKSLGFHPQIFMYGNKDYKGKHLERYHKAKKRVHRGLVHHAYYIAYFVATLI